MSANASAKPDNNVIQETSEESKSNKSTDLGPKEGHSDVSHEGSAKPNKSIVEATDSYESETAEEVKLT